jgi:hypothetical protein
MIKPLIFTEPFASGGAFTAMPLGSSGTQPNQVLGYPPIFATPYSAGGIPIDISQTNGVLNAYSTQDVWIQGGGQFTFEPDWITANTTYDAGVVLWCASNQSYQLSLQPTSANFISNPSYINDGVNWQQVTISPTSFANMLSTSGYQYIAGEFIIQWITVGFPVTINSTLTTETVSFPIQFPTTVLSVVGNCNSGVGITRGINVSTYNYSTTQCTADLSATAAQPFAANEILYVNFIAIGY